MSKKIAIIVFGSHFAGKSKTIAKYLKPLLGMSIRQRIAIWNGFKVYIKSQSLEEADLSVDKWLLIWKECEIIVIACRPENEKPSYLKVTRDKLQFIGFNTLEVRIVKTINDESYYQNKAKAIFNLIK